MAIRPPSLLPYLRAPGIAGLVIGALCGAATGAIGTAGVGTATSVGLVLGTTVGLVLGYLAYRRRSRAVQRQNARIAQIMRDGARRPR